MIEAMGRDARLAVRALRRTPGFTVAAVLTLAIGMGGTALMLTAANAAFRQPLAFGRADGLVHLWQVSGRSNQIAVPLRLARDWERALRSVDRVGLSLGTSSVNIRNGADAERAIGASVDRAFFATLGVNPTLGRSFSVEEAATQGPVAAVISDALWERLFARTPDVLSRVIHIEGVAHPIVGVMPAGFAYPLGADLWTTFERNGPDAYGDRTSHNFEMIARLAPGVTLAQAQSELDSVTRALQAEDSAMRTEGFTARVSPFRDDVIGGGGVALQLLTAAVLCVLLIACVNVANLMLARSVSRESQATLRVALGATSADLVRLFVVESVTLATAGAMVGAVLVVWASSIANGLLPPGLAVSGGIMPDARVLALCAAIMLLAGIICGAPSALHGTRLDLRAAMSLASRAVAREPRGMAVLTGVEVALACVLLVGAGLLLRSLARLEVVDPGFQSDRVLVSPFTLGAAPGSPYAEPAERARFLDGTIEHARRVPGVTAVGVTSSLPFTFSPNALLEEDGVPMGPWGQAPVTHYRVIGGDVFPALGVSLVAGRFFTEADRLGAVPVAIVNQATVRQMWNGQAALGRRVRMRNMDGIDDFATIVGIVADVRHRGLTAAPVAEIFFPYAQRPQRTFGTTLVVKLAIEPASAVEALRASVRDTDAAVPSAFVPLADRVDALVAPARFRTRLLAAFAAVALGLAAVGLFAVVSYSVARRTREIGIRMALGADAGRVQRLVILRGMQPVILGTIAGAWIALVTARSLASLTFDVSARDPWAIGAALTVLPLTGLLATWLPARRATRVDPTTALRTD